MNNKRLFEHHIGKILKQICDKELTYKAKKQLNDLLIITCKLIINKICFISYTKKKFVPPLHKYPLKI